MGTTMDLSIMSVRSNAGLGMPGSPPMTLGTEISPPYPLLIHSWVIAMEFDPPSKSSTPQLPAMSPPQLVPSDSIPTEYVAVSVKPEASHASRAGCSAQIDSGRTPVTPVAPPERAPAVVVMSAEDRPNSAPRLRLLVVEALTVTVPPVAVPVVEQVTVGLVPTVFSTRVVALEQAEIPARRSIAPARAAASTAVCNCWRSAMTRPASTTTANRPTIGTIAMATRTAIVPASRVGSEVSVLFTRSAFWVELA